MRGTRFAELSAFVAVAGQNSFNKAATQLGISPATLSQSIRSLEDGLGVRLFNRTTRSVRLTDVGSRLLSRLQPALADYEAAIESVNAFREKPSGSLRLSVLPPAAEFLIAPLLPKFLMHHPDIRVEISTDPALTDIVAERFDAGIRFGRLVERDMVAVRISGDVHTIAVAAPEYLARCGTPKRPENLQEHNCIHLRFPSGVLLPWRFRRRGNRVEIGVEGSVIVNDPRMAVMLAADGVGVIYTLDAYAEPLLTQRKLVTVLDDWMPRPDSYYLYYPSRRQNTAALQAFVAFLKANVVETSAKDRAASICEMK